MEEFHVYVAINSRSCLVVPQECESGVSLDYLEKLHEEYIKFIDEMMSNGSQVLRYDWSTFKDETIAHVSGL